jgi:uncharacterized protein
MDEQSKQPDHSESSDYPIAPVPAEDDVFHRMNIHPVWYALFALIGIFFLYQVVGGGLTILLFGLDFTGDNIQLIRLTTLVGQLLFLLVPTLILLRFQTKNIFSFIRFKPIGIAEVVFITIGVLAAQQFLQGYMALQDLIPIPESVRPFVDQMRESIEQTYRALVIVESIPELLFVMVVVAVVPAFSEEFLFRGLVQRNFEHSFGLAGGAIAAGIIFGLYHLNPFSMFPLIVLGVLFGLLVYKTGSILSAVLAHFVNNTVAIVTVYYRREEILLPGDDEISVAATAGVMLVSGFVAVVCWILLSRAAAGRKLRQDAAEEPIRSY